MEGEGEVMRLGIGDVFSPAEMMKVVGRRGKGVWSTFLRTVQHSAFFFFLNFIFFLSTPLRQRNMR